MVLSSDGKCWIELHGDDEIIQPDGSRISDDRLCIYIEPEDPQYKGAHTWLTSLTVDELIKVLIDAGEIQNDS